MTKNNKQKTPEKEPHAFRMLHAAKWYSPTVGGIETAASDITGAVQGKADVDILVCSENGRENGITDEGVPIKRVQTICNLCSTPLSIEYITAFRKMSKDADLIQIHAPFPLSDLALFLCKRKRTAKVAVWWHSDVVKQKRLLFFYRPLMKSMLKRADIIFVAGQQIAKKSAYLGPYSDKVKVIPFGINSEKYGKISCYDYLSSRLTEKNSIKLLFVGRLVYYKGVEVLLRAMQSTQGCELFIIGTGELEGALVSLTKELGLESRVHFLGKVGEDELNSAFNDSDIFILPSVSRSECFGLVQLEAMTFGKPVINTSLPTAVPEVSIDGETGITVTPGDAAELSDAINRLVSDRELRERYGMAAKRRCEEHFSLKMMQEKLYNEYIKLLFPEK